MPNGTGLAGQDIATRSAVIVPLPSVTLYYIFTVDDWQNTSGSLDYSVVDMSENGGLGDAPANYRWQDGSTNPAYVGDGVQLRKGTVTLVR